MNHMELQHFKTDKNGTKYFYDWKCPRCCGYGMLDKWINTGKTCYACGGSGVRTKAKIVKEYTPEYWAKLDAKQKARNAKRAEEAAKYAEEHADEIAEAHRKAMEFRYSEYGCGKDGVGYVLKGNTYPVKDEIMKNGGRWIYGCWICPVEINGKGITSKRIEIAGHMGSMGWKDDGFDIYDEITG